MTSTLITTPTLAVLYLFIVRFVDMNEKEPLWAMLLLFVLGAIGSVIVSFGLSRALVGVSIWVSAATNELVKFMGIGAGVAVLVVYGQRRGWEEFNGTMDGIVYGTCAGLGFGVGEQAVHELTVPIAALDIPGMQVGVFTGFWKQALSGLADGIFGAIIGAGFGAAARMKSAALRGVVPVFALLGAIVADGLYGTLRYGNSLGDSGAMRTYIALFIPLVLIALVAGYALAAERGAIGKELDSELQTGAVGAEDLALLKNVVKRQLAYTKAFFSFKLGFFFGLRDLHNLQVQLAFAKARMNGESDAKRRAEVEAEIGRIRAALVERRRALGLAGAGGVS
jgi:RsiW-degrading membrane proteinase PrsW (M82 family)